MQLRLSSSSTVLHFVIVVYILQNRPPALFLLFKKWDRQRAIEHLHHPPSPLKPLLPSAICWVECTLYIVQPTLVTGSTAQDQISKSYWGHIGAVKAGRSLDCLTSQLQCSIGLLQLLLLVTMDYHKLSSWAGTTWYLSCPFLYKARLMWWERITRRRSQWPTTVRELCQVVGPTWSKLVRLTWLYGS